MGAILNDHQLRFIQTANRMTNVVVWSTVTSLFIETFDLCVETVDTTHYTVAIVIYGMGSLTMFVCTYFMYDFSRKKYIKVCSCCDTAWSRCFHLIETSYPGQYDARIMLGVA